MTRVHPPNLAYRLLVRWFVCTIGLWVAAALLGDDRLNFESGTVLMIGGLILALINAIIKPIVVIFSLPAILFTLGLFMIVINGLMVMLASAVYDPLQVSGIWSAMLAGIVIGLVNYLVTAVLEDR